jgi:hypothetical protein
MAEDEKKTDESAKESQPAESGAETPRPPYKVSEDDVITNEDLERMMEGLSPLEARSGVQQGRVADAAPASGTPDPPAPPAGTKPAAPKPPPGEAEQKVADLQARVAELEKAVLAVRNPLLPRTWTTPDSMKKEDEESGYSELDNTARLGQREAELAAAREELAKARQELSRQGGGGSN